MQCYSLMCTPCAAAPCPASACLQVLNLLLYALTGRSPDPVLLEFLRCDEHLVDIGDDLCDYEEDVAR